MGRAAVLVVLTGCGFHAPAGSGPGIGGPDASVDSGVDTPAPIELCAPEPGLRICFSFDADPLPSSLPNEGSANVAATLANVTRLARGPGGAALLDTMSQMRIPPNSETTGFLSVEAWVRVDADPPAGDRIGILDSEATPSAVSLFYYNASPNRQVRFHIGQQIHVDRTLDLGAWHYLAQVCDNNTLTAFVNGVKVGEISGCTPGIATTYGLQLGQNNTGTGGDEWLTGAIDGLRMWTVPLSAAAICRTAGRTDC